MAETQEIKSNLSPVAQEVMPYMEKITEILRRRDLVSLANKLVRQAMQRAVLDEKEKADFNSVVDDVRTQMMKDLEKDENGQRIVSNYLDGVQEIVQ